MLDLYTIAHRLSFACRKLRPQAPRFYTLDRSVFDAFMRNWRAAP
jgi:hypothetical protein